MSLAFEVDKEQVGEPDEPVARQGTAGSNGETWFTPDTANAMMCHLKEPADRVTVIV